MAIVKNKPVIMFPMRLEVYHSPLGEVWLRWYPDDCQMFPPVGSVDQKAEEAYTQYLQSIKGVTDHDRIAEAWARFVNLVGVQQAKYLLDRGVKFKASSNKDGLSQFMEEGIRLKALPKAVKLFTIRADSKNVEFLAEGKSIPDDLVITVNNDLRGKWLYDFEEAVNKGMGIKLTNSTQVKQFDSASWVMAVGFKEDSKKEILPELFLRHKARGDLEVLGHNTPTNNTENNKSGFTSLEDAFSQEPIMGTSPAAATNITGAKLLSAALNIDEKIFSSMEDAGTLEYQQAFALNNLLWDICTHDYRQHYMNYTASGNEYRLSEDDEAWDIISSLFKQYVLGQGMLPSLRIGTNPYGILPVTVLDEWQSSQISGSRKSRVEQAITSVLKIFKKKYLTMEASIPYLDLAKPDDSFSSLVKILQQNPVSHRVDVQPMDSNAVYNGFTNHLNLLSSPLVQNSGNKVDYLDEIIDYFQNIYDHDYSQGTAPAIQGIGSQMKENTPLLRRLLIYTIADLDEAISREKDQAKITKLKNEVNAKINDLKKLKGLSSADLEELLLQFFDCLSYRLDAWISALSLMHLLEFNTASNGLTVGRTKVKTTTKIPIPSPLDGTSISSDRFNRNLNIDGVGSPKQFEDIKTLFPLKQQKMPAYDSQLKRVTFPNTSLTRIDSKLIEDAFSNLNPKPPAKIDYGGELVGVFGWLEKPGQTKEIQAREDGYFQAPSLDQAATGAVLRNGVLSMNDPASETFQVNLSSERVQKAQWYIEGMRQGYTHQEILGYQAERLLHDYKLDKYLLKLRKLLGTTETTGTENFAVMDGEKFINQEFYQQIIQLVDYSDQSLISQVISEISQTKDAVADLFITEAVYHTVTGNTAQAAAWMEAAEGKTTPPEPKSMKTFRTGQPQLQRVIYPLGNPEPVTETSNPRAIIEPVLVNLCNQYLEKTDQIYVEVKALLKSEGKELITEIFSLMDLQVEPVDILVGGKEELENRISLRVYETLYQFKEEYSFLKDLEENNSGKIADYIEIFCNYQYSPDGTATMAQIFETIEKIKEWLQGSRVFQEEDMIDSDKLDGNESLLLEIAERKKIIFDKYLQPRLAFIYELLIKEMDVLKVLLEKDWNGPEYLRNILLNLSKYGLNTAMIPVPEEKEYSYSSDFKAKIEEILNSGNNLLSMLERTLKGFSSLNLPGITETFDIYADWSDIKEPRLKYQLINATISQLTQGLEALAPQGGFLRVIPPLIVSKSSFNKQHIDVEQSLEDALKPYSKVRRGIHLTLQMAKMDKDKDYTVQSRFGVQSSPEDVKNKALEQSLPLAFTDFSDFTGFLKEFNHQVTTIHSPSAEIIFKNLDAKSREIINGFKPDQKMEREQQQHLINDFNNLMASENLFDETILSKTSLSSNTEELIKRGIHSLSTIKKLLLSRYVLEDVFPGFIRKTIDLKGLDSLILPETSNLDLHFITPAGQLPIEPEVPQAMIIVDEWPDNLPDSEGVTGLSFYYDTPQAEAPQVILLAVPPKLDNTEVWKDLDLAKILMNTIELMKVRSVSSEAVAGSTLGYILPSLLFSDRHQIPAK